MEFDPTKIAQMMGQAQAMQQKMLRELEATVVEGQAGGGMVRLKMNGNFQAVGLAIDPAVVNPADVGMLEDLVRAAINDASRRVEEARVEQARSLAGSMGLPPGML